MVVDAAAALADRDGLGSLTLATVARDVGVTRQALAAHVAGLEGLRRELFVLRTRLVAERVTRAVLGRSRREALRAFVDASIAFDLEHPGLLEAQRYVPAPDDEEAWEGIRRVREPLTAVLAAYELSDQELVHWHRIITSAVHGYATFRAAGMLLTYGAAQEETVDTMVDAFSAGLVAAQRRHRRARPG
jgi:AcrR family transcriptional regulator